MIIKDSRSTAFLLNNFVYCVQTDKTYFVERQTPNLIYTYIIKTFHAFGNNCIILICQLGKLYPIHLTSHCMTDYTLSTVYTLNICQFINNYRNSVLQMLLYVFPANSIVI